MSASSYDSAPTYAPGAPATPRHGAGMATAALVLGILALVSSWTVVGGIVLGLLAVIFGFIGVRRARVGAPGKVRAIVGIVLGAIGVIVAVVVIAAGVAFWNSGTVQNYRDCVNNSNGSQSAIDSCAQQFKNDVNNN